MLTKLAAVQTVAAYGPVGPIAMNGSQFVDESAIFPDKSEFEHDGLVVLGDEPGLGCAPDEAAVRRLATDIVRVVPS